jgi:hypothetical protein
MKPNAIGLSLFVAAAAFGHTAVAQVAPVDVVLASHEPACEFPVPLPLPAEISCSAPWTARAREPLPYAYTWQSYRGAQVEHACYGVQRLPAVECECCSPEPYFPALHDWFDRVCVFLKAPIEGCRSKGCSTYAQGDYIDSGSPLVFPQAPLPAADPVWQFPAEPRPLVKATPVEVAPPVIPPASATPQPAPSSAPAGSADPMPTVVPESEAGIEAEFPTPEPPAAPKPVVELAPEPALPDSTPPSPPRNRVPQPKLPSNKLPGR